MVSTDSFLAGSIKLQVFTTMTSAWSGCGVSSCPCEASWPIMTSLSTRFLGQPKLTKPTFKNDYLAGVVLTLGYHADAKLRTMLRIAHVSAQAWRPIPLYQSPPH